MLKEIAQHELRGVGNPALGEWEERGNIAFHLRRRLTQKEADKGRIASVVDVRGTPEAAQRIDIVRQYLPPQIATMPIEAFP